MKRFLPLILFIVFPFIINAQISYQGPAEGSVSSCVVISTDSFGKSSKATAPRVKLFINEDEEFEGINPFPEIAPEGSNILPLFSSKSTNDFGDSVFVVKEFDGMPHRNSIPPDPYLAVGPNHIVQVVNTYFRITDKEGNTLKEISANSWYASTLNGADPFDPKIIYDSFDNRWVMVWLNVNTSSSEGYFLFSVSDDDNPLGTWYNWALPSNVNGNTPSGSWADYEGVGYDAQAIYLTSNQFKFTGSFEGAKIRIIDKMNLYANEPGEVTWYDLWKVTYPASSYSAFGLRPVRMAETSSRYYFAVQSPYSTASNIGVYVLENAVTSPSLNGYSVNVTTYSSPPNAQQLGGSSIPLESGGKNLRNEPVVKNNKLHFVHSVAANGKSAVRYICVNLASMQAEKDIAFADGEHYYIYPSLTVDDRENVFFTYSRSSASEYIGAGFMVYSLSTNMYSPDFLIEPGYGNYVVDYGSGRNRWGDYSGAWLDPDKNTAWFATEYVASTNHWGVRIAGARAYPFEGARAFYSVDSVDFGQIEVGNSSDVYSVTIKNFGDQSLEISSISTGVDDIKILNTFEFPLSVATYDSVVVNLQFVPTVDTVYNSFLSVVSNSSFVKNILLKAEGYILRQVEKDKLYAVTGNAGNGVLATVDMTTGEANVLGESHYKPVRSVTINPQNNYLYALAGSAYDDEPVIVAMTSADGSAYPVGHANVGIDAFAFNSDGILYAAGTDKKLYQVDLSGDSVIYIADLPTRFAAITFNPQTGELFATSRSNASRDLIMKVNIETGDTTHVGRTGRNKVMFAIAFDRNGKLFGAEGVDYQVSNLIEINTTTGEGTLIGSTGIKGIDGMAYAYDGIVGVEEDQIVNKFVLEQNYPNPFNPETTINFTIPRNANVSLKVYDVIGREVAVLMNEYKTAGSYSVKFNAGKLSSGLYIYRLEANGISISKKMMLLK